MTKDSKLSRITDSASRGKGESMALEARKDRLADWIRGWSIPPNTPDDHTHDAHNDAINMVIDQLYDPEESGEVDALLAECSRLASRVAILQSALLQAVGEIADYRGVYQDPDTCEQKIAAGVQRRIAEAEKLLAGAHAEEKD